VVEGSNHAILLHLLLKALLWLIQCLLQLQLVKAVSWFWQHSVLQAG
jgi:hypothetical protein